MNIVLKKINEIEPYSKNPRKNDEAVKYVVNSINEFGFKVPVVIDKNGVIVAGHTRYKAARKLHLEEIPCIIADDLTDEKIKAFRLADNKVSEQAEWDELLLLEELEDITALDMGDFGFDDLGLEEEKIEAERKDLSDEITESYQVIIECEDEAQQEKLYYQLQGEGYKCRTLTL